MTVTISLSPQSERDLAERAAARGQNVTEFVQQLIVKELQAPKLSEILAPVRQEFSVSGMSESELDSLIEECRNEVWS